MRARAALAVILLIAPGLAASAATRQSSSTASPEPQTEQDWLHVIAQLKQQLQDFPGHAATKQQLAIAYNNYGVSLGNQGNFLDAKRELQEALDLDAGNAQFKANLVAVHLQAAQAAQREHDVAHAKRELQQALALDPKNAQAYTLLGELEYDSQHLREAKAAWQKASQLDPSIPGLKDRFDQVQDELPVESTFEKLSASSFDIRYNEGVPRSTSYDIQTALINARREVGTDFKVWPRHKLLVIVYDAQQFRQLRQNTPDWVAGQFDGKIRVPLPSGDLDLATVQRTLVHEYTHALIYEITQGRVPTWFNEGLAEYEAWKPQQAPWPFLRQAAAAGRLLPWAQLSGYFSSAQSPETVALAYEQSHSIVQYLAQRHGFWRVRRLLDAVAKGSSLDDALFAELRLKPARIEQQWLAWLADAHRISVPTR